MKRILCVILVLGALAVGACGGKATPTEGPHESPLATESPFESPPGLANPASLFCLDQGYELDMRSDTDGTAGFCIFPDGTECEEWAFFRGECGPGTPQP